MKMKFLILTVLMFFGLKIFAQTTGTLNFSVTTTEPAGGFTGKHVIAIWITNSSGVFVKTNIKYAATREQYLNQWITNSGRNVTDAITGATLSTHGVLTFSWNGTNVSGTVVPDGTYQVWLQMADQNVNGQTATVSFTKGNSQVQLSPSDAGNFTSMSLKWTPSTTAVTNFEKPGVVIFPNPSKNIVNIDMRNGETWRQMNLVSSDGRLIKTFDKEQLSHGTLSIEMGKYGKGVYFLNFSDDNKGVVYSVVID